MVLVGRFNQFDEVTRFRLQNAFIFALGFNLIVPVLLSLKGQYLASYVITLFLIGEQLSVKSNRFFVEKFSVAQLYRMGILIHLVFIVSAIVYFYNPLYMVVLESFLSIFVSAVFGAYSIKLNNHLARTNSQMMKEFQIVRNSIWADGLLLGLCLTAILTYFWNNGVALGCFIVYNSGFVLWMIYNYNFYNGKDVDD